jgi:eukaryotic-like serine/threonine-protein kinase
VKSLLKLTLLMLVLLMVALISALTAMRIAIHGREVVVPKLVGLTPVEAERTAAANGLQMQVERRYYSPTVPEGRIMSQVPDPGSKVRRGWQLRVAESLGPQRVAIPDVVGQTSRAATINIQRRGLDVATTAVLHVADPGPDQVLGQSPSANASGVSAPRLSLLVTAPPEQQSFVMPNFVGQTLGTASQALQAAGIHIGNVTVASGETLPSWALQTNFGEATSASSVSASPFSLILAQAPGAGQKVTVGSTVNFEVSH